MARRRRISPAGFPLHVIQRGNNRSNYFLSETDFIAYVKWLNVYAKKFNIHIHAWVLMTNHVHLLCTPQEDNRGVSAMMQSIGRMYVRRFNAKYERTGTLWEGRFRSCVVDSEKYLMTVSRYIELNPVRAGLAKHPANYKWSSYHRNARGVHTPLCTEHPIYTSLGTDPEARQKSYSALFQDELSNKDIERIRTYSQIGKALGSEQFKTRLYEALGSESRL